MAEAQASRLGTELGLYESRKSEWLREHAEQFVVVKGEQVLGFYPSFDSAYRAGANNFGVTTDFLVKRIVPHEPVFLLY